MANPTLVNDPYEGIGKEVDPYEGIGTVSSTNDPYAGLYSDSVAVEPTSNRKMGGAGGNYAAATLGQFINRSLFPYEEGGEQKEPYRSQIITEAFGDEYRLPLPKVPKLEASGGKAEQVARGLYNVAGDVIDSLPTAGFLATVTLPPVAAYVGINMVVDAFRNAPEAGRSIVDEDVSTMESTAAVAGVLLGGIAPLTAKFVKGRKQAATAKAVADAEEKVKSETEFKSREADSKAREADIVQKANAAAAEAELKYREAENAKIEQDRQRNALAQQAIDANILNKFDDLQTKSAQESAAVMGIIPTKSAVESASFLTRSLDDTIKREQASITESNTFPAKTAEESASIMGGSPTKSASDSASIFSRELGINEQRALNRTIESQLALESARSGNMERALAGRQGASPEVRLDPAEVQRQAFEKPYKPSDVGESDSPRMSAQARKMSDQYGGANIDLLSSIAQMTVGSVGGYSWGYYNSKDLPKEEQLVNAFTWGIFGGLAGSPLRGATIKAIGKVSIPTGTLSYRFAGAENFYLFPKVILQETLDVLKGQGGEIQATGRAALNSFKQLESLIGKSTSGDRIEVGKFLRGDGSSGNIFNLDLKLAAENVRSAIDNFTIDLKARGLIKAGSDLAAMATNNLGSYLTRSYRVFADPNFKPPVAAVTNFVNEYINQGLVNNPSTPIIELRNEGTATAMRILAKGQGGVLETASQFALGNGIAKTDGSFFKPRKALSDATRQLMGEIDDPIQAAGQTINRMAYYIGQSITQSKMREVGLRMGIFSETATDVFTKPMTVSGETVSRGPLANLFTTAEASNALRSNAAYNQNGVAWRALSTVSAASKITKTAYNIASYAPNFLSQWLTLMSQGDGARILSNPKAISNAIKVTFDDVFPVSKQTLIRDGEFLLRERVTKQNVNLNDLVSNVRAGYFDNISAGIGSVIPKTAKFFGKVNEGVLKAYGIMEEFPRVLGFYLEVARYKNVFPNMSEAEVYQRAAKVTRDVFPNSSEVPDILKKLSLTGGVNPFVNFQYETMFRNPYNTFRIAASDIAEGRATNNPALVNAGIKRASWFTGTVFGSMALNEALKDRSGVDDKQAASIKRLVAEHDQTGLLAIQTLTRDELAYSNQSYLIPQSIPAAAMEAALSGVSPLDASLRFGKEIYANFSGGGGTLIGPAFRAITGRSESGRQLFNKDSGKYFDVSKMESKDAQDFSLGAQRVLEGVSYVADKSFKPGTANDITMWSRLANNEVGPDGELYRKGDLAGRLLGLRTTRLNIPDRFDRKASLLASRLNAASESFNNIEKLKTSKKEDIDGAYKIKEQARIRIFNDIKIHLEDGKNLIQPRVNMIDGLREAGVDAELISGALHGYYVTGKQGKEPSTREKFNALMALSSAQKDAAWSALKSDDINAAREMRPMFRQEQRGISSADRVLLGMNINDGTRAINIATILRLEPDDVSKSALYNDMRIKGIINREVDMQLRDPKIQARSTVSTKVDSDFRR